jgi:NosR/NirI family transcriptional regulator, nitrous oxide reductase regulator
MNPISRYFNWLQKDVPTGEVINYPVVDEKTHETNVKGIYAIGDLSGLPLLRFAAQQGYEVTNRIYEELKSIKSTPDPAIYDIVIVGAGAAGLSCALEAKKHHLNYIVLESTRVANTVVNFPKGKHIFAEPKQLVYKSALPVVAATKEETLEAWYKVVREEKLNIREGFPVKNVKKQGEYLFDVVLENGDILKGKRVILAIGKAGQSRKLGVPGENLPKVTTILRDPAEFENQNLLVVGGGDSAVEAACALAEHGNNVTISYRKGEFSRIKEGNAEKIAQYQAEGKLKILFKSEIKEITEFSVRIKTQNGEKEIDNDMVFTLLGSELPYDLLKRLGLNIHNSWSIARIAMFAFSLGIFTFVYFGKHYYHENLFGQPPSFWYSLLYTLTVGFFGVKRMIDKPYPYIRKQTISLFLIQALPLFFIPTFVLPYMDNQGWIPQWILDNVFPYKSFWRLIGFVLPWPLVIYNVLNDQPVWFWIITSIIQTFILVPVAVRYFGKGAICGWVCSCGALAETLGDSYRKMAPHGPKAKRWENFGQVVLAIATFITALYVVGWFYPSQTLNEFKYSLVHYYALIIDTAIGGVVGVGAYFFYSGRIWCRFACPLAALMHIYGKFSKYRIFSDKKKCISCGVCTSNCHMGIDVMGFASKGKPMDDVECVRCSACVTSCPMQVLSFGRLGTGHPHDPTTSKRSLPVLPSTMAGKLPLEMAGKR